MPSRKLILHIFHLYNDIYSSFWIGYPSFFCPYLLRGIKLIEVFQNKAHVTRKLSNSVYVENIQRRKSSSERLLSGSASPNAIYSNDIGVDYIGTENESKLYDSNGTRNTLFDSGASLYDSGVIQVKEFNKTTERIILFGFDKYNAFFTLVMISTFITGVVRYLTIEGNRGVRCY